MVNNIIGFLSELHSSGIIGIVFLDVFPIAVGQICWSYALGHFGAARAGNFLYLVAPLVTLLAGLMYGEVVSIFTIAGGILVLCGVILVNTRGRGIQKQL